MGSLKGGSQRSQAVDYTSLTDAKIATIVQGNDILKRRKSVKISQPIWNEAQHMNRVILDAPDGNFYYLLSGFKPGYASVAETLCAATFKEDFFDYILENISYTKVNDNVMLFTQIETTTFLNQNKFFTQITQNYIFVSAVGWCHPYGKKQEFH